MSDFPTGRAGLGATEIGVGRALTQANQLKQLGEAGATDEKKVDKAAGGFEALLLQQMLKEMWNTVDFGGLFEENSYQSQMYRDMFNQALSDSISEGKGVGIKEFVKDELKKRGVASKG